MSEKIENRCWDCPRRRGLSRVTGTLACKFWEKVDFTGQRVKEQRGDCTGAVPARLMSQGRGSTIIEGDTVTHKTEWDDVYLAACPKEFDTPPDSPDEVKTAMRINKLPVFIHETINESSETLEAYEQRKAEMRSKFAVILDRDTR